VSRLREAAFAWDKHPWTLSVSRPSVSIQPWRQKQNSLPTLSHPQHSAMIHNYTTLFERNMCRFGPSQTRASVRAWLKVRPQRPVRIVHYDIDWQVRKGTLLTTPARSEVSLNDVYSHATRASPWRINSSQPARVRSRERKWCAKQQGRSTPGISAKVKRSLTLWRQNFLLNFSTPCI